MCLIFQVIQEFGENLNDDGGRLRTQTRDIVQKVPHNISHNDMIAIDAFCQILAYGAAAEARGLKYQWPTLPNCNNKQEQRGEILIAMYKMNHLLQHRV